MGFLDDISKRITDAGQKTLKKTKEISDTAKIHLLVDEEEKKLNNFYYQIGKLYVSKFGDDCDSEFVSFVNHVYESEKKIKNYKKQIQDIKGIQRCENCGAEVPQGVPFCSSCGFAMPKVQVTSDDNYVRCEFCGTAVKKEMRFCTSCGKPMSKPPINKESANVEDVNTTIVDDLPNKICPNCGVVLTDDAAFCAECGTKL